MRNRMNRSGLVSLVVVMLSMAAIVWAHHGPIEITIDKAADKQGPVVFPHGKHATELVDSCDTCHHTNKGLTAENDPSVEPCSTCHLDPKGDVPGMREMSLRKNPFHIVCIDCHKEQAKGPTKCNDCHRRK